MPDFSLPSRVTLIFGRSGSGKTTFAFKYLVNAATEYPANPEPAGTIFIFDWKLEASQRLGISPVTTEHGCLGALASRWVVLNPHPMFPGDQYVTNLEGKKVLNDVKMGLRWFLRWVYDICGGGPGRKIVYVDELWDLSDVYFLPPELEAIARTGRHVNLELLTSTQFPADYHRTIRKSVTEWVCFNTDDLGDLDAVRPYYAGVDKVTALPKGSFIAFNRDSKAELAGKLF